MPRWTQQALGDLDVVLGYIADQSLDRLGLDRISVWAVLLIRPFGLLGFVSFGRLGFAHPPIFIGGNMETLHQRCDRLGEEIDWLVQSVDVILDGAELKTVPDIIEEIEAMMTEWKNIQQKHLKKSSK